MRPWTWSRWSIGQNLALSTFLQVLAIAVVIFFTYFSRLGEIRQDLDERGALIATAVAENSQYGIVSGNYAYLHSSLRNLLASNKDVYSVEIRDKNGVRIVQVLAHELDNAEKRVYSSSVLMDASEVNLIDFESSNTDVPSPPSANRARKDNPVIGGVVITLSAAHLLGEKRTRLLVGLALAGGFLLLSIADGFRRARALTKPLVDTVRAIREIREGSYDVHFSHKAGPELTELQTGVISMAENLRQFHQGLEDLVVERTKELEKARDEALLASTERKLLIQRVSTAAEAERYAIAVDIHDHLNALVVVARLEAKAILKLTKRIEARMLVAPGDAGAGAESQASGELEQRADNLLKTVTDLYQMGRDIIKRLRPEVIDTLGLDAAVSEIVSGYNSVCAGCTFEYESDGPFLKIESKVALSAYRLVQESISNIVKHAKATRVRICLTLSEVDMVLRISVTDNGKGFDMRNYQAGIGLIGMRERVSALGGTLDIQSTVGSGTSIQAEISVQI